MRRLLAVAAALVLVPTACSSSDSSKATPPAPTSTATSTTASTTTSSAPPTTGAPTLRVAATAPPAGISAPAAQWLRVTRADGETQLVAVYRPSSTGPHPVVVLFHGSSGLATVQLAWASILAQKGYIVVAGCYLDAAPGSPSGVFLPCPGLPDDAQATFANERPSYTALLDVAAGLDGVEVGAMAVVGMSLGAILVLSEDDSRVKAIVADSGYRQTPGTTKGPVLLLGFTNDPRVAHSKLVAFEHAQQGANPVTAHYYVGGNHVALLTPSTTSDATARTVAFLQSHLG